MREAGGEHLDDGMLHSVKKIVHHGEFGEAQPPIPKRGRGRPKNPPALVNPIVGVFESCLGPDGILTAEVKIRIRKMLPKEIADRYTDEGLRSVNRRGSKR